MKITLSGCLSANREIIFFNGKPLIKTTFYEDGIMYAYSISELYELKIERIKHERSK